jgi:hypothetical protein
VELPGEDLVTRNLSPQFGSADYYQKVISGEHPPALFASGRELVDTHLLGDQYGGIHRYDKPKMWNFKTKEDTLAFKRQNKPDLIEQIKDRGYDWTKPALIHAISNTSGVQNTGMIADGHHRIAAMQAHRPDEYLPIRTLA